jgi:hypothetical protein
MKDNDAINMVIEYHYHCLIVVRFHLYHHEHVNNFVADSRRFILFGATQTQRLSLIQLVGDQSIG